MADANCKAGLASNLDFSLLLHSVAAELPRTTSLLVLSYYCCYFVPRTVMVSIIIVVVLSNILIVVVPASFHLLMRSSNPLDLV